MCEATVSTSTENAQGTVKAEDLCVAMGSKVLLKEAKLVIASQSREVKRYTKAGEVVVRGGSCYALVGANGSGKSTLLRLLVERRLPMDPKWRCLLVDQHLPAPSSSSAIEAVLSGHPELQRLLKRRDVLEADESEQATVELLPGSLKAVDGS